MSFDIPGCDRRRHDPLLRVNPGNAETIFDLARARRGLAEIEDTLRTAERNR